MEVVRQRLRERRYSPRTQADDAGWVRRFIRFHGRRHPNEMAELEVSAFLSSLAVSEKVAASTQKQAIAALVFLYDRVLMRPLGALDRFQPARTPAHVPTVLSRK